MFNTGLLFYLHIAKCGSKFRLLRQNGTLTKSESLYMGVQNTNEKCRQLGNTEGTNQP